MFTGIVVTVGKVTAKIPSGTALRFVIEAPGLLGRIAVGDSVSCEGACLTVETLDGPRFTVCAVQETLAITSLAAWSVGTFINLEPALLAGTPLGGHFVLGHVDGVGEYHSFLPLVGGGGEWVIRLPENLAAYCVSKGSITVCGVSLTVAAIQHTLLRIALIPHTLSHTTLGGKAPGDWVNIEVDILAKHVETMLLAWRQPVVLDALNPVQKKEQAPSSSRLSFAELATWGYTPVTAVDSLVPAGKP
jgi:riboflavin synthase